MSALIASVLQKSISVKEKLASATRAVSILSLAAPDSTESVSLETNTAEDGVAESYALEVSLLPARIRKRYLETLVEWVVQAISKSSIKDKTEAAFYKDVEAWKLVSTLLHVQAPASAVILTEGLLPAMVVVLSDPATTDDLQAILAVSMQTLLATYRDIFRPTLEPAAQFAAAVLCNQQHGSERSSTRRQLACLAMRLLRGVTSVHTNSKKVFVAVSGKLLAPLLQNGFAEEQPGGTPVKLSSNAGPSTVRADNPTADARNLLQHILFNSSHLAALSSAAATATAASRLSAPRRNAGTSSAKSEAISSEAAISVSKEPRAQSVGASGGVEQPYQRLLFESLLTEVQAASTTHNDNLTVAVQTMQRGLPWMLKSFCAGVRAHHRQQATGGTGEAAPNGKLQQNFSQKLPADADFMVFAALGLPLLEGLEGSLRSGITAADTSVNPSAITEPPKKRRCKTKAAETSADLETIGFEHVVADLCCVTAAYHVLPHNFYRNCSQRLLARRAAAALLREVTEQQAYRPTADASAWQSAFLGRFAEAALQVDQVSIAHKDVKWVEIKACADHAAAAAELLVEVLQLEYSPLQAQLPRIWSLIWLADSPSQTLQQSQRAALVDVAEGEARPAVHLAAQVVSTHAQLRQVPALLKSLTSALHAAPYSSPPAAAAATSVVCSLSVTSAIQQAVSLLPTGQARTLVDFVSENVQAVVLAPPSIIPPLAEVLGLCLEAIAVNGAMAPIVAAAIEALLAQLNPALQQAVQQMQAAGQVPADLAGPQLVVAAVLRLHSAALRLHAHCSALRPDVQRMAASSAEAQVGHFDYEGGDGDEVTLPVLLIMLPKQPQTVEAAAVVAAAAGCCSLRLQVLRERLMRCLFTCPLPHSDRKPAAGVAGNVTSDSAKPLSTPNTQDIEDQIRVLCIWMLACADYAAAEATLAAVAWSQVASRVTPQHLLSAIWPHLLQSLSAAEDVDSLRADASNEDVDMYTRALSVALRAVVARDESRGVLGSLKGLSERLLSPTHLVTALRLRMLLPAALSSAVEESLGLHLQQRPPDRHSSPEPSAAYHLQQLPSALMDVTATIAAAGGQAASKLQNRPCDQSTEQSLQQQACALLLWAASVAPELCSSNDAAEVLAVLALQVEMMAVARASATAKGDNDGNPRQYAALVAASRALLAAVVRQKGVAAGWLCSNQGIWLAWLLTSWQLAVVQGWECEVTMREHTCAAITASAHAAALQGGSTPNAYAAATFSQAIRAQLQEWERLTALQRLGAALGAEALLAAATSQSRCRLPKKLDSAALTITAGTRSKEASSRGSSKSSSAATAASLQQGLLTAALCQAVCVAARGVQTMKIGKQDPPITGSGKEASDSIMVDRRAAASLLAAASYVCACPGEVAGESTAGDIADAADQEPHLQITTHASFAVALLKQIPLTSRSVSGESVGLCARDTASALQLLSFMRAAVPVIQGNKRSLHDETELSQAGVVPRAASNSPTAVSADGADQDLTLKEGNSVQHNQLVTLHLHLLQKLVPVTAAPLPAAQASSAWGGFPSIGGAPPGLDTRLRLSLLESLRQVLVGATSGERHITEALLQAELSSCSGAVSGLPALEACLLALEGTDGGSPSKAHTSMAERFISAVLTCLNLAATCAAPGWPAFPEICVASATTAMAAATGVRCLESVAGRPRVFALTPEHVASILQVPWLLFGSCGAHGQGFHQLGLRNGAGLLVAASRAMASTLRNHHAAARRCMAIVTASGQALLSSWMAWQKVASSSSPGGYAIEPDGPEQLRQQQSQQQHNALLKSCASAIAAVWVAVADQSDLSRYCVHMLADYVNIVLLRKQEHSASLAPQKKHVMCDAALPGDAAYAAMRSGAYYMYAACSSAEVQHLYVTVGSKGGGIGRTLLADLKKDYERHHKYSGKI